MKIKALIFMLFSFLVNSYSQREVTDIFKTLLILNQSICFDDEYKSKEFKIENLLENVDIEIEELKPKQIIPLYLLNFKLYIFDIEKNNIIFKNKIPIVFKYGVCTEYIVAYNEKTMQFYRMKGFKCNDFIFLLNDIFKESDKKVKIKEIIKELDSLNFDNLNFDCMYKALKDSSNNLKNYPCILSCMDPKYAHLSR